LFLQILPPILAEDTV